ncbi:dihydrolipoamide acetyltransferase component of pyruvate dehydrogenase complex [Ichthyobacterium seriolicida]|uniref:Dihydrolipoamide acetyltransferase component of pyruvate dehydrogenase complex n=2 Tax=Ichthyobacterium seriolicida TaxID=242600 RepID=A0A1J1E2S7_9FLAO|nr:dihydrolipoamide acetyltransferase component of pyruvate dehydrogenase complex [Ichthyobacterium seriolicida]
MTEGVVSRWYKKIGDKVSEGDILADIETDKATMEFESFQEGTLLYIGIKEGESAKVDSLLAILGEEGTDISSIVEKYKTESTDSNKTDKSDSDSVKTESTDEKKSAEKNEEKSAVDVRGINTRDDGRLRISPIAKKMAMDKGMDITKITGTGDFGRIIKRDIDNFKGESAIDTGSASHNQEAFTETDISPMRKVIANRLSESKFTAPHYYLTVEIDMGNAITARKSINESVETKVSFNDIIVKAASMALAKHPEVNTNMVGTDKIRYNKHINIGVAIAIDGGLLVPVVRYANTKSISQISHEIKDLSKRARDKKLLPADWEGSTFTISNLGMLGIESFTSIINQPDSAIMSVGAIIQKPVVKNGQVTVGNTMKITLACDHRTIDGMVGALFLQTFKKMLENPINMLA